MSFVMMAPHQLVQTTMLLPSPEFGDSDNIVAAINLKRSMNNTKRTYINVPSDEYLIYEFILTRGKTLEVIEFLKIYYPYDVRIINHKNETYVCKIMTDPFDFSLFRVAEESTFRLELRGRLLNG